MVLEGDSQVLMIALISNSLFLSFNSFLIDNVRFGVRFFTQLRYSHIKEEDNKVVYNLA